MTTPKVSKRKNVSSNKKQQNDKITEKSENTFRYGPMPTLSNHRIWSRGILIFGVLIYVWYTSKYPKETTLARQKEVLSKRGQIIDCDSEYIKEMQTFPGCVPDKCGRYVSDKIVTMNEAEGLLNLAKKGLALGGSSGGASILDLHTGALSYGEHFVNIYKIEDSKKFLNSIDVALYKIVKTKIQHAIAKAFQIDANSLYLTHPTFFSKINNLGAKTIHDEYWRVHVDKETYESFHYTSLLYLSDYNVDFKGGRFIFAESTKNSTVEPRKGRVLFFTSGAENPHCVEKITDGTRYAVTVSFTCDESKAITCPLGK